MFAGLQLTPVVLMLHTLIRLGIDLYHILGRLLNEAIWIIDWLMDRLIGRLSSVRKHLQNALHAQTATEQEHDSETS